jgi:hypothetical protein
VSFLQQTEVFLKHSFSIVGTNFPYLGTSHCESIILGDSWQYFLLLGLVVKNVHLFLVTANALLSEERVASSNDDGLSVLFGAAVADKFPDVHHRSVAYAGITNLLELSLICHLRILGE